jgi:hypothetical protein
MMTYDQNRILVISLEKASRCSKNLGDLGVLGGFLLQKKSGVLIEHRSLKFLRSV